MRWRRTTRALLLIAATVAFVAGCGAGLPAEAGLRGEPAPTPALRFTITEQHVSDVADVVWALDNGRYEYFQAVSFQDGNTSGSTDVPLVRGARSGAAEQLTAELGVDPAFAANNDSNTRMHVVADDEQVCINVPFYERVIDRAGPSDDVAWMVPLVEGWGCIGSASFVGAAGLGEAGTGLPTSALNLGDQNLYLRMTEVLRSARIVSNQAGTYRGTAVTHVEVELDRDAVARRFGQPSASMTGVATATLSFDAANGELISVAAVVPLPEPFSQVEERLEIYGRGSVEPIGIPDDATDISAQISQALSDD